MKEKIINSYINKLTRDDIIAFSKKNDINLENNEIDILLEIVKNDWKELLSNPDQFLADIRNKVSDNTYKNIIYFYNLYSDKLSLL
jgi:predicted sulfurtransferase